MPPFLSIIGLACMEFLLIICAGPYHNLSVRYIYAVVTSRQFYWPVAVRKLLRNAVGEMPSYLLKLAER